MNDPDQQSVAIIDLGAGNLRSVHKAIERAARNMDLDAQIGVTTNPEDVRRADRIVLPGVGAFQSCMDGLNGLAGMRDALEKSALEDKKPLLGICVGMQMLATRGLEFTTTQGLNWIPGEVKQIDQNTHKRRVPHMGWNQVKTHYFHDLFGTQNKLSGKDFYFLHSFHFESQMKHDVIASTDYYGGLVSAVARDNIVGVQFHPEKSQEAGLALLQNFLRWRP